jgi:hypothetical protein
LIYLYILNFFIRVTHVVIWFALIWHLTKLVKCFNKIWFQELFFFLAYLKDLWIDVNTTWSDLKIKPITNTDFLFFYFFSNKFLCWRGWERACDIVGQFRGWMNLVSCGHRAPFCFGKLHLSLFNCQLIYNVLSKLSIWTISLQLMMLHYLIFYTEI